MDWSEKEKRQAQRNLNPHAEAIAAMLIWGQEYSEQRGGSMDFWDTLSAGRRQQCKDAVDRILSAKRAPRPAQDREER